MYINNKIVYEIKNIKTTTFIRLGLIVVLNFKGQAISQYTTLVTNKSDPQTLNSDCPARQTPGLNPMTETTKIYLSTFKSKLNGLKLEINKY